jgi:predicted DNA-binding protein (UPF0251 family)
MARPIKPRMVAIMLDVTYFKPVGIPAACINELRISLEEAEAIRLKDVEGLGQEQSAGRMMVSRPTFHRVLTSARRKMADALLNGKAIRIDGGYFEVSPGRFKCSNGHKWDVPSESMVTNPPQFCPTCITPDIEQLSPKGSDCPFNRGLACCSRCVRNYRRR